MKVSLWISFIFRKTSRRSSLDGLRLQLSFDNNFSISKALCTDLEAFYCGRFFISFKKINRKGHMNFYQIINLKIKSRMLPHIF